VVICDFVIMADIAAEVEALFQFTLSYTSVHLLFRRY
jgi:hypothetical protein